MTKLNNAILIPALALLLLAAAFVGYQAVSAQNSPGSVGGDPPSPPTGLTAEPVDGLVHLSWDALGDDSATDVHVSRTVDGEDTGGHWIHLTNSDGGTTSYIDHHQLEPGTTYVYTVGAQNEFGQGSHSEPVTVTTDPPKVLLPHSDADAPSAPSNVTAVALFEDGRHKIRFAWAEHASDEGVTGWQITRVDPATSADLGYIRYGERDHTFTSYEDLNVDSSTIYTYTVHAISAGGHGEYSERVTVTTGHEEAAPEPAATPTGQ